MAWLAPLNPFPPSPTDGSYQGFGIAGVTSATMFPDSRYILSTTGASNQPAVITAQSHTPNLAPKLLSIESPRAAIAAGAVARDGNAYALLAPNGGKVFVSRLVAGGTMGYQADSKPAEKLVEVGGNFVCGDVGFGEVGIGEKEVLVAAFVVNPRLKMGYFAEVRAFGF